MLQGEKIRVMATARARMCRWLAHNCRPGAWNDFTSRNAYYLEKPMLDVPYANYNGHHGKTENYHQALAIQNTVSYVLQKARITGQLTSKPPTNIS
jgi:hypothetical protein